jgi:proteasome lid subunit RPN8/RPN11
MKREPPRLPPALLRAVFAHAAESYPEECCGVLYGPRGAGLDEARRCENASGTPATGFGLAFADLAALADSLPGARPARVVYHSHVDAPPRLSAADVRLALLGGEAPVWPLAHLVVEVRGGVPRGAALHAWDSAERRFREVARWTHRGASTPAEL